VTPFATASVSLPAFVHMDSTSGMNGTGVPARARASNEAKVEKADILACARYHQQPRATIASDIGN
jgi:hypothetical protein